VVVAAGAAGVVTVVVLAVAGVLYVVVVAATGAGCCTVVRSCTVHAAVAMASVKPMIKNFMRAPCAWTAQVAT
jgi:hypothetical protein